MVCCFVQQYRNCLIETLTKKFGQKQKPPNREAFHRERMHESSYDLSGCEEEKVYSNITATKSPECIPFVSNDFLTSYLPLKCNLFPQKTAIGLTQHMCMWLYDRKFTKARLELLP